MLAYASLAGVAATWRYGAQLPGLPRAARLCLNALAAATAAQVALGIHHAADVRAGTAGPQRTRAAPWSCSPSCWALLYSIKPAPSTGHIQVCVCGGGCVARSVMCGWACVAAGSCGARQGWWGGLT